MKLTANNFDLYAAKYYDNINCIDMLEFYEDLNRIKYLKKLFKKYKETNDLKPRLVLNHLTVLYNVFSPPSACTKMLVLKLRMYITYLKPFLIQLNYWPDIIEIDDELILGTDIELDQNIIDLLRKEFKNANT